MVLRDLSMPVHQVLYGIAAKLRENELDKLDVASLLLTKFDSLKDKLRRIQYDAKDTAFNLLALHDFYLYNQFKYDSAFFTPILNKVGNENLRLVRYIRSDLMSEDLLAGIRLPFPDVALADSAGVERKLSRYTQDVLVVDLWASWCSPCRYAIQHELKGLSAEWKKKGIQLIGVDVDEDKDSWLKAMRPDKPEWPQLRFVSENNADPFARFNTDALPAYYVLNNKLEIVYTTHTLAYVVDYIAKHHVLQVQE